MATVLLTVRATITPEAEEAFNHWYNTEHCNDVLKLPGKYDSYKWPTLAEAYRHFTGKELEGAHDALVDSEACLVVFRGLVELGFDTKEKLIDWLADMARRRPGNGAVGGHPHRDPLVQAEQ